MFLHEGPNRSAKKNRLLAGYLALVAGYVNSAGVLLIGSFTSHVTGNVGRLANDIAKHQVDAAIATVTMIGAFFGGGFVAGMAVESDFYRRRPAVYGSLLALEACLLLAFTVLYRQTSEVGPRVKDMEAAILCAAMGLQNAMVSRISGAVVRTTHLTGVVTDLAIESARWFRAWRGELARRAHVRLSFGTKLPERPSVEKIALLGTIVGAFVTGAISGALLDSVIPQETMLIPTVAIVVASIYAFVTARAAGA